MGAITGEIRGTDDDMDMSHQWIPLVKARRCPLDLAERFRCQGVSLVDNLITDSPRLQDILKPHSGEVGTVALAALHAASQNCARHRWT